MIKNIIKKSRRIHDNLYLKKSKVPKDSFKFITKEIIKNNKNKIKLIDIGCAAGDFLYYFNNKKENSELYGSDINPSLLIKAKKVLNKANYFYCDINKKFSKQYKIYNNKFDVAVFLGVHSIFDNVNQWVKNLIYLTKKNGQIYIFGSFNKNDYDVIVRVRKVGSSIWEEGFNRISLKTIILEFEKYNFKTEIKKFNISIDIKQDKKDPRRSWTFKDKKNSRIIRNGLELFSTQYLLIIKK